MNQLSQGTFARATRQVKSPVSRRRTHRLLRLGLVCGGIALAAAGLLLAAFTT
jgi:hypothetical protein